MKKKIIIFFTCMVLIICNTCCVKAEDINSNNDEILYKFDSFNEEVGDILYDKNSPIIVDGKKIKLNKIYESSREMFRGTWIATISNINFPKDKNLSFEELVLDFNEIIDRAEKLNLNAIFFQVSPELDAFYESDFRPWSKYLTGEQGIEPNYHKENKDFLKYAINETRRRGMEFHAWFNPYRVTKDPYINKTKDEIIDLISPNNFARKNKNLAYLFSGKLFLDPGRVEVIEFINDTIHEFITKYDVDGIHFDDYFYPYGSQTINNKSYKFGELGEDKNTFIENSRGIEDINNWRRDNINILVKKISSTISHHNFVNKKSVQFGISPFGIYAHKEDGFLNGSNTPTTSLSSYRDIYADSLYWVDNDLIDYIIPQIYWTFGKKEAAYEELVNFWSKSMENKRCQLYIGHGNYCVRESKGDKSWNNPYEIKNQIKFNELYENILGSSFFSINDLKEDYGDNNKRKRVYKKYINSLEEEILNCKALIPKKPWLDFKDTINLYDIKVLSSKNKQYIFFKDKLENDSKFYVVYGFENKDDLDYNDNKNILGIYGRNYDEEFQSIILNKQDGINVIGISIKDGAGMETKPEFYDLELLSII